MPAAHGHWRYSRVSIRGGCRRSIYRSASPVGDADSPSAAMGHLLAGRAVVVGQGAAALDRPAKTSPPQPPPRITTAAVTQADRRSKDHLT
jgi:hypothetical protein